MRPETRALGPARGYAGSKVKKKNLKHSLLLSRTGKMNIFISTSWVEGFVYIEVFRNDYSDPVIKVLLLHGSWPRMPTLSQRRNYNIYITSMTT